jgi:hypothetical protein
MLVPLSCKVSLVVHNKRDMLCLGRWRGLCLLSCLGASVCHGTIQEPWDYPRISLSSCNVSHSTRTLVIWHFWFGQRYSVAWSSGAESSDSVISCPQPGQCIPLVTLIQKSRPWRLNRELPVYRPQKGFVELPCLGWRLIRISSRSPLMVSIATINRVSPWIVSPWIRVASLESYRFFHFRIWLSISLHFRCTIVRLQCISSFL